MFNSPLLLSFLLITAGLLLAKFIVPQKYNWAATPALFLALLVTAATTVYHFIEQGWGGSNQQVTIVGEVPNQKKAQESPISDISKSSAPNAVQGEKPAPDPAVAVNPSPPSKKPEISPPASNNDIVTRKIIVKDTLKVESQLVNDKYFVTIEKTGPGELKRKGEGFGKGDKFTIGIEGFYPTLLNESGAIVSYEAYASETYFHIYLPADFSATGKIVLETARGFQIEFCKNSKSYRVIPVIEKLDLRDIEVKDRSVKVFLNTLVSLATLAKAVQKEDSSSDPDWNNSEVYAKYGMLFIDLAPKIYAGKIENSKKYFKLKITPEEKKIEVIFKIDSTNNSQLYRSRNYRSEVKELKQGGDKLAKIKNELAKIKNSEKVSPETEVKLMEQKKKLQEELVRIKISTVTFIMKESF